MFSMFESNSSYEITHCNKTSLNSVWQLHWMIFKNYKHIGSFTCLIEELKWWWVAFNYNGVVDAWQLLQHFFPSKYECSHIASSCDKSPTSKSKIESKGITSFWKDCLKCCLIAHKTILVIINISSITIKYACFNIYNVEVSSMIVIKYPLIDILNIECIVRACGDNGNVVAHVVFKSNALLPCSWSWWVKYFTTNVFPLLGGPSSVWNPLSIEVNNSKMCFFFFV